MFENVPHEALLVSFKSSSTPPATGAPHRQALKWYNRGLSNLQQRMERNEMDSTYALLTCILCTCIEFQQNNIGNAMELIQSGFKVLSQTLRSKKSTQSAQMGVFSEVIVSFFTRHAVAVANFVMLPLSDWSGDVSPTNDAGRSVSSPSDQVSRIRSHLFHLMYQAYQTVRVAILMWQDVEIIKGLLSAQRVTIDELKRWRVSFTGYCSSHRDTMSGRDMQLLTSHLLISWNVCYIWLEACTEISEMAYDKHMDHFAEILLECERVLALAVQQTVEGQPRTKIVVELVPPLYFTVMKCRDPVLRRKALALLEKVPPDGPWADVLTARVVRNAITLEEGQPYNPVDLTEPKPLCELRARPLPPEDRRLHTIAFTGQERTDVGYTTCLQLGKIAIDASGKKRAVHETIRIQDSTRMVAL
ncbi:uncharacterized protein A1O9_03472 [Exophiala aquamarina CBS 119918]|uniref:Uncharacterized protein n=1 Tax=Exophiala aquamarina CBS 119918 TaxID=1182545 RepID=A0A072Q1Y7_9EURO|nr:uncharacterized protein A1O9_03472 [Exophiala aquamarina CBS 119918]KEF61900.1 hypothetical protein A1O9_03472 [Exophiala aquamarina CBS 119918]